MYRFFLTLSMCSTRMRHGDGRKTLGVEESYTIGSYENESFCKNKNFARFAKNVDDRIWVIYSPDCCLFFEFVSSSLLGPHVIHILLGLAPQRKLLNAPVQPTIFPFYLIYWISPQRAPGKTRQDKARTMDLFVVVPAQLLLFFKLPLPQRHLHVPVRILAADHETDLARRVRRDRGVGVFDRGEYFFATFLQVGDKAEVQPLVFSLGHPGGGGRR